MFLTVSSLNRVSIRPNSAVKESLVILLSVVSLHQDWLTSLPRYFDKARFHGLTAEDTALFKQF